MKNWNYIEGAKTGNGLLDILKSEKPIKMKSSKGAIVTIHPDGSAAHQDKEGSQMAVHHYNSFKEAVEYYKNQGYEKVGNDTPWEYAHRKPKVINDDKTGAEEFFKQLSDDVKEREKKDDADIEKVGNREIYVNQSEQTKAVVYEDGTIMLWDKNGNNYKTIKAGSLEEARKKLNSDYKKVGNKKYKVKESSGHDGGYDYGYIVVDESNRSVGRTFSTRSEAEEYIRDLYKKEKVGNALNWDENLVGKFVWVKDKGQEWKVYVMQDKGDKVYIRDDDGSQGWVSKTRITGKVGNRVIEKESEMSQELKNLLKKAPAWIKEKIEYAFSHGFTIDEKDFINAIKKEVGNSKVRNSTVSEYNAEIQRLTKKAEQLRRMGQGRQAMEVEKQIEKLGKELSEIGNSASDDKFAYVMREFDAGKLKTPDGKVVTDPAQAKAIAYSESKKTENGLARARKAMNADSVIKYKGFTIKYRPFSGKYYISSGPNDTYVGKYAYKEYSSEQDAKDAIDGLK